MAARAKRIPAPPAPRIAPPPSEEMIVVGRRGTLVPRWAVDASSPKKRVTEHPEQCRRCGCAIPVGSEAQLAPFAVGGMWACSKCDFYAPGEPR